MKKLTEILTLAVVCGGLLAGIPARADWMDSRGIWHRSPPRTVVFRDADRVYLRNYVLGDRRFCPAGTVQRGNHCITRFDRTVYYRPGKYLPSTVVYEPLPGYVTARLATPPAGAIYVRAGNNIYLVSRRNRLILDAVSLMGDLR